MSMNTQEKLLALKSVVLTVAGLVGIGYQQVTGKTDLLLLIVFTTMIGVPGLAQLLTLVYTALQQGNIVSQQASSALSEQVTESPVSSTISATTDGANDNNRIRNTK